MAYEPSFGTIENLEPLEPPTSDTPMRIAVLADFSGRHSRGLVGSADEIASRKLHKVNRENLDDILAGMAVTLRLPVDGSDVEISFASLDDFGPDALHDRVDAVADAYESSDKTEVMNTVMHHADFQALESAWRGVYWLLGHTTKGSRVEVALLDVSLAELAADLKASDNLAESGLYQLLIQKSLRGAHVNSWGAFVAHYVFDPSGEHAELLGRLAKIGNQANAPVLTTIHPQVLDASFSLSADAAPAWQALRALPESIYLGISVPRFLLRLPYGDDTQPASRFSYEEVSKPPEKSAYLWGNAALACAALLAASFQQSGWAAQPGAVRDLDNLPIHVYSVDGDEEVTLAEAWLVRPHPERLSKLGIMSFLCVRGKPATQLVRFQSLAEPAEEGTFCELWGHWCNSIAAPTAAAKVGGSGVALVGALEKSKKAASKAAAATGPSAHVPPAGSSPPKAGMPERTTVAAVVPVPVPPPSASEETPAPAEEPEASDESSSAEEESSTEETQPEETESTEETPTESSDESASSEEPSSGSTEETPPAEEEMDPDLAALLKQLE